MNNREIFQIISYFASKRAPSGMENERGELFGNEVKKLFSNKDVPIKKDNLGNFYVKLKGRTAKKKIAILAHIDEIGGTIRKIKSNGKLEFSRRGGYEGRWLVSKKVKILNKNRQWINGIIEGRSAHSTSEHLRIKEKIDPLELEIFIGAASEEEVKQVYNVRVGAPFVFDGDFKLLNPEFNDDLIEGYSMDNLAALTCLVVLLEKLIKHLMDEFGIIKCSHDIYLVATTREEIGTEGALYFLKNNPVDKTIAIDIGIVADFKGSVNSGIKLNEGPAIIWVENRGSGIFDYNMCSNLVEVAEKNKIKYQDAVVEFYGSDAGKAQKWLGIPSALIGIPTMYSHNVPEVSSLNEIERAAELIYHYIKQLE